MTFLQALSKHPRRLLRVIAQHWGVQFSNLPGTAGIAERLATRLADSGRLVPALAALPDAAKSLLQSLAQTGGQISTWQCLARGGPLRPYRPWVSPREGRRAWGEERGARRATLDAPRSLPFFRTTFRDCSS